MTTNNMTVFNFKNKFNPQHFFNPDDVNQDDVNPDGINQDDVNPDGLKAVSENDLVKKRETELLNQGGYGCVYHPAIECDDSRNSDIVASNGYISKVQFNDKSSHNEIEIGKIIKTISNYNNFFAPIVSSCSVDINRIDKELTDIYGDKCAIYEKQKSRSNKEFVMLSIPYIKDGNFNKNIINSKRSFSFINLIDTYKHLLNALILLDNRNIVHYDLKNDNILYNKVKKQPIIIDFGLSIDFNQIDKLIGKSKTKLSDDAIKFLYDKFYVFAPDYYLWCIEIHAISYLVASRRNVLDDNSIAEICVEYVENNKGFVMFDDSFKENYIKSASKFLSQYKGQGREKTIISLLEFHRTWDNFSISIMFLKLLYNIFKFQTTNVMLFFYRVLIQNLNPDPKKRLSVNDTFRKLFEIYNEDNNNIDDIIKIFVGTDINVEEVKSLFTRDQKHFNSIIEKMNTKKNNRSGFAN